MKEEVDEIRAALREKSRENRELTLRVQALERNINEYEAMKARLFSTQDELNDAKIKIEKFSPFLAEVSRLRGTSRASLRSLQEQVLFY